MIQPPYSPSEHQIELTDLVPWLLDQFPLGVFLFQGGRFPYFNARAAEILGRSVEELRSLESPEPLVFSPDYANLSDWFGRLLGGKGDNELHLFRVVRPDTTLRRVLGSARRIFYKGIPAILGAIYDASEWMEAQYRIERSRRLDLVGHMADAIGNDLNNLLSSVLGNASLLRETSLAGGGAAEPLLEIETGALQSADLVARLLNTSTRRPLLQRTMNLNETVSKAAAVLRSTTARHIDIRVRLSPAPKPILGDPGLLEHVVLQLGLNACEAMPHGGILKIETGEVTLDPAFCRSHPEIEPGDHMRVRVEDEGRGIAPEILDQVFDPFFSTKTDVRGAGVGLTLAYNLVAVHGGCIDLRSWLGQGTCVDVYFPVMAHAPGKDRLATAPPATAQGTILVVDDDELARSTASRILQRHGYTVIEASRGEEGLEILRKGERPVDLVLLDLIMPGLTGRQTLEQLRSFDLSLPVVLISGHSVEVIDSEFERLNVQNLVKKPYRPVDLVQAIGAALESRPTDSDSDPTPST